MDDSDSPLDQPDHPDQGNHDYQEIPKEKKKNRVRFTQMHSGVLHHTLDPSRFPIGVRKTQGN